MINLFALTIWRIRVIKSRRFHRVFYHRNHRPGKIQSSLKPMSQRDLSLAYSPAEPHQCSADDPANAANILPAPIWLR
jgi:malic enzyme